ncbi:cold shock domain-containing protein [Aurantimonas sp. E1-2-R+4]|uniref:cold-shock protein n=1 Tax=Aurantimonas sp. E1-2-R+4 TaxID=3113714 RepID=UPI002F93D94C
MAKNRDRRGSHRSEWSDEGDHNFQEPSFFQKQPSRSLSNGVDAEVLWFNSDKGFGFVQTPDGGKAFLHIRQLEAAGYKTVADGTAIKVVIQPGDKGPHVAEVLDVAPASASRRAPHSQPESSSSDRPVVGEVKGVVKFYHPDKGFGFIGQMDGGKDIFVHVSTLGRSGIAILEEGQVVWVQYAEGAKGLEARSVRIA